MLYIIRLEFKKAWHNTLTWLAALVGVFCAVLSLLVDVVLEHASLGRGIQPEQVSLLAGSSIGTVLDGIFIPVLAALPAACSYFEEKRNGIVNHILTRTTRRAYFSGKALVSFLFGLMVSILPFLLNYALCLIAVSRKDTVSVITANMGGVYGYAVESWLGRYLFPGLYLNHPVLNQLLLIGLVGIWGGGMALLAYGVSLYFRKHIVLTAALPGIIVMLTGLLLSAFGWDFLFIPFQFGLYSVRYQHFWGDKTILLLLLNGLPLMAGIVLTLLKVRISCDEL